MAKPRASKGYDPKAIEPEVHRLWTEGDYFHSEPDDRPVERRFSMVIPPPNVTGALHLGHAINNTLQDILVRKHRMAGFNTVWIPGTDHAGIATQAVVERRLREEEGKSRHDVGREALVERIWSWKDAYEKRILDQLRAMGASCDWQRTRFTLDDTCARAVRHFFFGLFERGYVYRGLRLVNWDVQLQTAVADDEVYHDTVSGSLWHLRYPIEDPRPGEPTHIVVATTRPETMLGDTAVAVNPEDERFRSLVGRTVRLPLVDRSIPIIADAWADPEKGSGCVKITPAHDPNDYEVGLRHELPMINVLEKDGTINEHGGEYRGLDRYAARKKVVADLEALDLLDKIEPYEVELGHSDRSKTPVEPYLAEQWFISMGELATRAMDTVEQGRVRFHPERYSRTYLDWLSEKRDWCISRQLWWGHRIPIWYATGCTEADLERAFGGRDGITWRATEDGESWLVCSRDEDLAGDELGAGAELHQDPDVLDTWFSSALWPHSTLGWPEPNPSLDYYFPTTTLVTSRDIITLWVARMVIAADFNLESVPFTDVVIHVKILDGEGQTMSKSKGNGVDPIDIIERYGADALRYTLADMATETQDVRMPVQYACPHCGALTPQTAERRALRQLDCGGCKSAFQIPQVHGEPDPEPPLAAVVSDKFELARNFCNKLWQAATGLALNSVEGYEPIPLSDADLELEDRWILSRLSACVAATDASLSAYRFSEAVGGLYAFFWDDYCSWYLEMIKPRVRDGHRRQAAQQVMIHVLDQVLRMLHPIVPFITESIWQRLGTACPERGVAVLERPADALIVAAWPEVREDGRDREVEAEVDGLRTVIRGLREILAHVNELRARDKKPSLRSFDRATVRADAAVSRSLAEHRGLVELLGRCQQVEAGPDLERPPRSFSQVTPGIEVYVEVGDLVDLEAERQRLAANRKKCEAELGRVRGKLSNEGFLGRAPAEVVDKERGKQAELEQQLATVDALVAQLES